MSRPTDGFTKEEWLEFYAALGRMTFNVADAAKFARHTSRPLDTVRDYFDIGDHEDSRATAAAAQYLKDLSYMKVDELYEKWGTIP